VPVYEGSGSERRLIGVADGEQDLTSNFFSDLTRSPKTPQSGRKILRTPSSEGGGGQRNKRRRGENMDEKEGEECRGKDKGKRSRSTAGGSSVMSGVRVRGGKEGGQSKMKIVVKGKVVKPPVGGKGKGKTGSVGKSGEGAKGKVTGKRMREEEEEDGGEEDAVFALQQAEQEDEEVAMAEVCVCVCVHVFVCVREKCVC